jgi:hypothetical protein
MGMIRAELRRLDSADAPDLDLERYVPDDPECFGIYVEASIGPEGEPGEELFGFMVCSPRWLATEVAGRGYLFARHYLILPRYDYNELVAAINELCDDTANELWDQAGGGDWEDLGNRLARYMHWEFEDFMTREQAQEAFKRFLERHSVDPARYEQREREEMAKMLERLGGPEKFTGREASEIKDRLFEEFGLPRA